MAKKKAKKKAKRATKKVVKKAPRKSRKGSRKPIAEADRKIQRQVYLTRDLIDALDTLRAKQEKQMRAQLGLHGLHYTVSWSSYVGSVLHGHAKARKALPKRARRKA